MGYRFICLEQPATILGDFGYIPTVIFISYFGSKGNRAKWISVGSLMAALAYLLIASPNFLFPVQQSSLNLTAIKVCSACFTEGEQLKLQWFC